MLNKIINRISLKENRRRYLNLKGIATSRYAFKGPDVVQVDLTDRCNSSCLACWTHSPFIKSNKDSNELEFGVLKSFINEIAASGTKEIIFSGGGEPFACGFIWDALDLCEKLSILFRVNTNFTLLDKAGITRLVSFKKLESLTISVWAADSDMFSKMHNREPQEFPKLKENIKFLNKIKRKDIRVTIYANINSFNYHCLKGLFDFASESGCNAVEFGVADVMPKVTDSLLLGKEQVKSVKKSLSEITGLPKTLSSRIRIANKDIFLERISSNTACFGEYNSFMETIPCYAGWLFLRIRANGDINSCLKSHRIPIGNIYKDTFSSVWNNTLQQQFREKSVSSIKDREYFSLIGNADDGGVGCRRICDNILVNRQYNRIMRYLFWMRGRSK